MAAIDYLDAQEILDSRGNPTVEVTIVLDDGALRFVKPNGESIDSILPGCTQPLGDWQCLPVGTETARWKGERIDYDLALEVFVQQSKRGKNIPAGTSHSNCARIVTG